MIKKKKNQIYKIKQLDVQYIHLLNNKSICPQIFEIAVHHESGVFPIFAIQLYLHRPRPSYGSRYL